MRDPWRSFLARVLPWFDQDDYDRERRMTQRVLAQADRVLSGRDRIREAYKAYADGMRH